MNRQCLCTDIHRHGRSPAMTVLISGPHLMFGRRQCRWRSRAWSTTSFGPISRACARVAVVAVVLFHVRLARFSGGFVGVDVFFVLSGFLITRLLLREVARTGTISLPRFWARRARRLLPASCSWSSPPSWPRSVLLSPLAQRPLATDAVAAGGFVAQLRLRAPGSATTSRHNSADTVAAAALLVAGRRGAVLPLLAADAARLASPAASVPPLGHRHDDRRRRCIVRRLSVDDAHAPDRRVLPLAGADVGARHRGSRRRRRLRMAAWSRRPRGPSPGGSVSPASPPPC